MSCSCSDILLARRLWPVPELCDLFRGLVFSQGTFLVGITTIWLFSTIGIPVFGYGKRRRHTVAVLVTTRTPRETFHQPVTWRTDTTAFRSRYHVSRPHLPGVSLMKAVTSRTL